MSPRIPPRAQGADYHETPHVQDVHAAIQRENREPRAGLEPLSLWLIGIYAAAIFSGGFYFGRYSGNFGGDSLDPAGAGEVTTIPADANLPGAENGIASDPNAARVLKIMIHNMKFDPPSIDAKIGDTVEWKNDDITPHTATAPSFDSASIDPENTWRHTFTEAGQFPYACTFHPEMKGNVVVK
jgi:plastocyanin